MMVLPSCKPDIKETGAQLKFFDLKGYLHKDSALLTQQNKLVFKTVSHNGTSESKKVHIANWGAEFSLFMASDINKPAWRDSYATQTAGGVTTYLAKYPELKTRKLVIKKVDGKVKCILIYNHSKNLLYESTEDLIYYPDSLYLIEKKQSVRFLGTNTYKIKGLFN